MSARIKLKDLSKEKKDKIMKHLYFQAKQTGFFKNRFFQTAKDPILLYTFDKPNSEVLVPYTFANGLLGKHINSCRQYPLTKFSMKTQPREYQITILKEALDQLQTKGTTTLNLRPGWGKSFGAAWLSSHLDGITLVVMPSLLIKKGWISTFNQFTDAKLWIVDSKTPPPQDYNVIICMDTMFHYIPSDHTKDIKTTIIDEAHMFCVPSRINCLLGTHPKYVIALTATLERRDSMHKIIHAICGTHGVSAEYTEPFTVYKFETGIKTDIEKTKLGNANWAKLVKDIAFNPRRNALIIDWIEHNKDFKIMVLTWNVKHAHFLKDMLVQRGIKTDVLAGNKTSYNDSRVLVASISKAGCGFDEQSACEDWGGERSNMLMLTGSTRSMTLVQQVCGRVFRASFPIIVDFVDDNRICKSHWRVRQDWYQDPVMNCQIQYLTMKDLGGEADEEKEVNKLKDIARSHMQKYIQVVD